jgi:3-dehydroquinate synthase
MSTVRAEPRTRNRVLRVELGDRSYEIVVGDGLLPDAGRLLASVASSRRVVVVTDANVAPIYLDPLERSLAAAGFACSPVVVLPAGEATKSFPHLMDLSDTLLAAGVDRTTLLVALGGGVVGDLAGFAAGILLRGLDFVQVPTTLLAQVDSSVGGKTGINVARGKNLVGLFHQPRLVVADVATLDTLDMRQRRAGYAEVVKYAVIGDRRFFAWLEANGEQVCAGVRSAQIHAVVTSCAAKAAIVAADEREAGRRALLNLGHTFGHALEAVAGYGDDLLHGEAVAVGMVLALELSTRLGVCPREDRDRLRGHLRAAGLPTVVSDLPRRDWSAAALLDRMKHDKKVRSNTLTFVLARGIGEAFVSRDVPLVEVRRLLKDATGA